MKQPLLMIIGDISDTRYMTDDKKVVYIEAANHIETYWKSEFVGQEVSEVIKFFSALYIIVL
ncbi:alpha/beta hydrolase [Lactobacillus salivarius]|uniref:Alpha/beta hydrolase n=1 Tax=Ligilactobacillus salivarius TaxID=1624 RepID=A0A6N9IUG0_9LACO|nr:alpha/beta hydrolase [Ligilactobacillus salivarius]